MKSSNFPIMPDAGGFAAAGILAAIVLYLWLGLYGLLLPAVYVAFVLYFFRNPNRVSKAHPWEIVSPADGIVLQMEELDEPRYLKGPAVKISIFMSVFNVHVNRSPLDAVVEYIEYKPGSFLPAFKSHASSLNEKNYVGLRSKGDSRLSLLVVQITGFIARRIVCRVTIGDELAQGERFGMIKFGSCVEVYLPCGTEVLVKKGQKVKGGETIIGRLRYE